MTAMLESTARSTTQPSWAPTPDLDVTLAAAQAPAQAPAEALDRPVGRAAPAVATPPRHRRRPVLSLRMARLSVLLMFLGFVAAVWVEPAPNGPQPVLPFWADAVATVTLVALLAGWAALAAGRRSGLWLLAVAGAGLVVQSALCPALDHHMIAAWWWAQLAVSAGITALSIGLLAGTRAAAAKGRTQRVRSH